MTKITALPTDTSPSSDDFIPTVDATSSTTKKTTLGALTPMDNPYKFYAYRNAAANTGSTGGTKITYDTEVYDTGNNYSTSTGFFTAPIAGFYHFTARFSLTMGGNTRTIITLFKNTSTSLARGGDISTFNNQTSIGGVNVAATVQLAAGDTVHVDSYYSTTAVALETGISINYFSGHLVSRT